MVVATCVVPITRKASLFLVVATHAPRERLRKLVRATHASGVRGRRGVLLISCTWPAESHIAKGDPTQMPSDGLLHD